MNISKEVKRFGGRDIIYVELESGRQPFYRSSGKNSGMKGAWLPFDGIGYRYDLWFDKTRFVHPFHEYMERYGTLEFYQISRQLSLLQIPQGEITDPEEINAWLSTETSLLWNKNLKSDWKVIRNSEFYKKWMQE